MTKVTIVVCLRQGAMGYCRLMNWLRRWGVLTLVIVLSTAARFWHIGREPGGFYRDESAYALDAMQLLKGQFALYFAANNGREGLFIYLLAGMFSLFGPSVESARATAALVGSLTVPAIYFTGRSMFSHRVGVLAAAILGSTFWHLALSRVAFRAITLPLLLCLAIGLWFSVFRIGSFSRWHTLLAGWVAGMVLYTYTSAQFFLPLLFLLFILGWRTYPNMRTTWPLYFTGFVTAIAPFAVWLTRHAELYFSRATQVSILSLESNGGNILATFIRNIGRSAGQWLNEGDRIWRHNLSLRPVFDGFLGVPFFFGCIAVLRRLFSGGPPVFTLMLWVILFSIPSILAEDTPHFLRGIGALPAGCLIAAYGMESTLVWLSRNGYLAPIAQLTLRKISAPALVAAVLLGASAFSTLRDYFGDYVRRPVVGYWLESRAPALASEINALALSGSGGAPDHKRTIYVDARLINATPQLKVLLPDHIRNQLLVIDQAQPFEISSLSAAFLIDPNHGWDALRLGLPTFAKLGFTAGPLAQDDLDQQPRTAYLSIQVDPRLAGPLQAGTETPAYTWENGISLTVLDAFTAVPERVSWLAQSDRMQAEDIAFFVHWLREGQLIDQQDGSAGAGFYPSQYWRQGDQVHEVRQARGAYHLADEVRVGLYRRSDGRRFKLNQSLYPATDDSAIIWRKTQ